MVSSSISRALGSLGWQDSQLLQLSAEPFGRIERVKKPAMGLPVGDQAAVLKFHDDRRVRRRGDTKLVRMDGAPQQFLRRAVEFAC